MPKSSPLGQLQRRVGPQTECAISVWTSPSVRRGSAVKLPFKAKRWKDLISKWFCFLRRGCSLPFALIARNDIGNSMCSALSGIVQPFFPFLEIITRHFRIGLMPRSSAFASPFPGWPQAGQVLGRSRVRVGPRAPFTQHRMGKKKARRLEA